MKSQCAQLRPGMGQPVGIVVSPTKVKGGVAYAYRSGGKCIQAASVSIKGLPNLAFNSDAPVCGFFLTSVGGGSPVNLFR